MDEKAWSKDLSAHRRSLLEAGLRRTAPVDAKQAVWGALATKLPAAAAAGAAAHAFPLLSLIKPLALGLALGTATAAGIAAVQRWTEAAAPQFATRTVVSKAALPTSPRQSEPARPLGLAEETPQTAPRPSAARPFGQSETGRAAHEPTRGPSVASFPLDAGSIAAPSKLLLESRRLTEARNYWRAGDARAALTRLDALAHDIPDGALAQERDALRIQALATLGERARAEELAHRFMELHPNSPHAQAAARVLGAPDPAAR